MRITEKIENGFYELKKGQEIYGEENGIRLVQVVGKLEDFVEEVGVPFSLFISLFKTKKIYVKCGYCMEAGEVFDIDEYQNVEVITFDHVEEVPDYAEDFANKWHINFYVRVNEYESTLYVVNIKDYRKTWGFSKEELE